MPLVKIEIVKGHSKEYKKTLLQAVHDALVTALRIPENDRIQRLYEIDADMFERDGPKTDKFSLIELTLFPGRTARTKEKAIKEIFRLLGDRLGIAPTDIFVIITDPPLENWGLRGEQATQLGLSYTT